MEVTDFRQTAVGVIFLSIVVVPHPLAAQQLYQHPPREIVEILDAPAPPVPFVSPAGNALILATPVQYRPISDLAEPMLHGAGTRINPRNNGSHLFAYFVTPKLQHIGRRTNTWLSATSPGGAALQRAFMVCG